MPFAFDDHVLMLRDGGLGCPFSGVAPGSAASTRSTKSTTQLPSALAVPVGSTVLCVLGRKLNDGQYYSVSVTAAIDGGAAKLTATAVERPELAMSLRTTVDKLLAAAAVADPMLAARSIAERLVVRDGKLAIGEPAPVDSDADEHVDAGESTAPPVLFVCGRKLSDRHYYTVTAVRDSDGESVVFSVEDVMQPSGRLSIKLSAAEAVDLHATAYRLDVADGALVLLPQSLGTRGLARFVKSIRQRLDCQA